MIPKVIHYCWFGGNEKPKIFEKCYKSWEKYCPDYEVIEWNESNVDLSSCPLYVRQAYENKKWAFVTDYIRLKVVYDNGGVYFDTDVELKKNPDFLLEYKAFFGVEPDGYVATGLGFGAEKENEILYEIMQDYEKIPFVKEDGSFDLTPCPYINTKVFLNHGFVLENSKQLIDDNVLILPSEVLCPINSLTRQMNITEKTVAIHWYTASWHTKEERRIQKGRMLRCRLIKVADRIIPDRILRLLLNDYLYDIFKQKANQ